MKRGGQLRRTELKRGTSELRRRTPLAQISLRRIRERQERATVAFEAFMRDGRRCRAERLVPSVACGGHLDAHERIPRSAWPGGHLVLANIVTICRRHHEWVDEHPELAHRLDLHGFSWERAAAAD